MSSTTSTLGRRIWLTGAFLAVATVGVVGLISVRTPAQAAVEESAETPPTPASVTTVQEREVTLWNEFSGRLEAVEHVDIRSRVAGTVQSVHFREGGLVKKGDLLITIDPAPYAAEADRAQAQVVSAEARVALSNSEYKRAQQLWKTKAISAQDVDARLNAKREAAAALVAARAALRSAKLDLGYTEVRAPIAGRTGRLEITVGNLVAAGPGAPILTTLVSIDPIYASFDADEEVVMHTLEDLPPGGSPVDFQQVPLQMSIGSNDYTGHLQLVDNQVDGDSGTVRLRAVFGNPEGRLMPGQFARLRMGSVKPEHALLISERAVGTDQDKRFVMVVDADSKAQYREVTLADTTVDGQLRVKAGIEAGERIVVNGLQKIQPGTLLSPQPIDEPTVGAN